MVFTPGGARSTECLAGSKDQTYSELFLNFLTIILMWGILGTSDRRNAALSKAGPFVIGGIVLVIGLCLGGPSGYAINPARDLGPRIFAALSGTKGVFDGLYWLIPPVLVPFLAAPIGAFLYDLFFASEKEAKPAVSLQTGPAD